MKYHEGVGKRRADEIIKWLKRKKSNDIVYPKEYKFTPHLKKLMEFVNSMKGRKLSNTEKLDRLFEYVYKLNKVNKSINEHIKPTLFKYADESKSLSDIIDKYNDRSYPIYYPVEEKPPFSDDYVTLSTIHGIKGGEFHTVFYLGTNDELYKRHKSFKKKKSKEIELQVMNVAVTRARRKLYLLFPIDLKTWKKGKAVSNPWRFLKKVDRRLLKIIT